MLTNAVSVLCLLISCLLVPQEQSQKQKKGELPRQPGDDIAKPLDKELPDETKARIEAQSWFMAGKVEQRKGRDAKAYEAFQKALDLDPSAVAVYREMIPLAFRLNKPDEAATLARKAIELDPDEYGILQNLAMFSAASGRIEEAIDYIERALKSKSLKKLSPEAVALNRDLVRLCSAPGPSQNVERAADGCDVLFDALQDPLKYKLDARAQRLLSQQAQLIGNVYAVAGKTGKAIAVFEEQARVRGDRPGEHNFNLARLYFMQKDYENAEKQLLEFFKTKPRDLAPYQMYVQVLRSLKRKDEAAENVEKFAEQDSRNAALQYFLADLYVADGRLDDAEGVIKKTIRMTGQPAGYLGLAEVYRQKKQPSELLDALIKASRANIETAPMVTRIAKDKEMTQKLLDEGKRLLKNDEDALDYGGNYLLGRLAVAAENTKEAVDFFRTALQLGSAAQVPLVSLELGTQLLFDEQHTEAATVFDNALKMAPRDDQQRRQAVFLYYRLAQAREFNDETKLALKALKEGQDLAAEDQRLQLQFGPLLHYQEGWTYFHAQQIDKAEEKLREVLQTYTSDPDTTMRTRMLLASVHSQQRDFPVAIDEFESIIRDYANNQDSVRSARMSLSSLYISKGDQPKAEAILEEVLAEDPDDPGVNNDLGYLYADQNKKLEEAEAMIRKAVESAPDNAAYLDSLGWVLFRREKYQEAIDYLEKAIKLPGGEDSTIVEHLGDNFERLGKAEEAMKNWKRALKIETDSPYPDDTVVKRLTKKVETGKSEPEEEK